ncbi:hypothetical protein PAEPH01_0800 [Pancytospora epiphaga]|nr:hypothetical protein PAEPH01_0800 [Pancytospora epiphaga]
MIAWDDVITNYHRRYLKTIRTTEHIGLYIQTIVLKEALKNRHIPYAYPVKTA